MLRWLLIDLFMWCYRLDIQNKNEDSMEGIIDIMKEQHSVVPGTGTDCLLRMLSFGDLLIQCKYTLRCNLISIVCLC